MKTPTRQRLIEAVVRRFYRDGFRNVGIDQILSDVGISKTAFYKHFECKEDLMLAALEVQNQRSSSGPISWRDLGSSWDRDCSRLGVLFSASAKVPSPRRFSSDAHEQRWP